VLRWKRSFVKANEGSNPFLSARMDKNPLIKDFLTYFNQNIQEMETFWKQKQQSNNYLETNQKYLIKIKETYYFCFRFKHKIIKISLKCKELYKSNLLKLEIIKRLKMNEQFSNMFNNNLTINTNISKDEDPQKVKEIEEKILNLLNEEKKQGNIKNIEFNSQNLIEKTISAGFEEFLIHQSEVENVGEKSIVKYKTSLKYILLFCDKDKKIDSFTKEFFKEIQNKIRQFPKRALQHQKYHNKKFNEIMKNFNNKDYERLSNQYINSLFISFFQYFDFFEYENYIVKNPVESRVLKSDTKHILNFENEEIELMLNNLDCSLSKDLFKIGLLTGMRISEIANMTKSNIDLEEKIITITESKTKSSQRVIPIHKRILRIIEFYYGNTKDEFLFGEDSVNKLTKLVNRRIKKVIDTKGKSFHSTRKNITMKMYQLQQNNKVQTNTIDRILGHKVKSLSFDIYNVPLCQERLSKSLDIQINSR